MASDRGTDKCSEILQNFPLSHLSESGVCVCVGLYRDGKSVKHLEYSKIDAIIVGCEAKDKTFLSRALTHTPPTLAFREIVFVSLNRRICSLSCCCCCGRARHGIAVFTSIACNQRTMHCLVVKLHIALRCGFLPLFFLVRCAQRACVFFVDDFCLVKFLLSHTENRQRAISSASRECHATHWNFPSLHMFSIVGGWQRSRRKKLVLLWHFQRISSRVHRAFEQWVREMEKEKEEGKEMERNGFRDDSRNALNVQ